MPQKARKAQSVNYFAPSVIFVAVWSGVTFCDLIVWAPVVVFGPLLIVVLRRALIFTVVSNDLRRFLWGSLILVSFLRKRSHRHHAEHRNQE